MGLSPSSFAIARTKRARYVANPTKKQEARSILKPNQINSRTNQMSRRRSAMRSSCKNKRGVSAGSLKRKCGARMTRQIDPPVLEPRWSSSSDWAGASDDRGHAVVGAEELRTREKRTVSQGLVSKRIVRNDISLIPDNLEDISM
jgi:hypothetical protein